MKKVRSHLNPATVIAVLALFVALGGSSFAAPAREAAKKLITGKQVKNNSISSIDVKNRSLLRKDFKSGQLPRGAKGDIGALGAPGAPGVPGAPGRSALTVLASGETVRGAIGARDNPGASLDSLTPYASLPIPAPVGLDDAHVNVDGMDDAAAPCTGTKDNPTAPPGYVCVYRTADSPAAGNNLNIRGLQVAGVSSRFGFRVAQDASVANSVIIFEGVWAYTAP